MRVSGLYDNGSTVDAHDHPVHSPISKENDLDIILLCGSPAAGKSTFYWTHLQPLGYERVNQDLLKTVSCWQKTERISDLILLEGQVRESSFWIPIREAVSGNRLFPNTVMVLGVLADHVQRQYQR